ncbi:MAG: AbrB/MazE/SpoVT family DNA-binding domain-containing protein [Acidobacteriota bacterium]
MAEATVSSKNQIVIPKEARDVLGTKPGDKLLVIVEGDSVYLLRKPKSYRKALRGAGAGLYPSGYLEQERKNWK